MFKVLLLVLIADVIVTVDGRRIEGEVVKETEDAVVIRLPNGELSIPRERIDKIIRTESLLDEYTERAEKVKTADEHYELGLWCLKNGLREQAKEEFRRTLALEPSHKKAQEELRRLSRSPSKKGKEREDTKSESSSGLQKLKAGEFLVMSNLGRKELDAHISLLKRLSPALRKVFGLSLRGGEPLKVVILSGDEKVREYLKGRNGYRRMFGGFYIEDEKTVVCGFGDGKPTEETFRLLVYQVLTERMGWKDTDWLYEGTVGLLKGSLEREEFDFGLTDRTGFELLKRRAESGLPLEAAIGADYSKISRTPRNRLLRTVSEFLLRLFLHHREEALKRYIRSMRKSENERFTEIFGSFETVEEQLKAYLEPLYATSSGRLVYIYRDEEAEKALGEAKQIPKDFSVWRASEFLLATDVGKEKATEYGLLICELLEKMRSAYKGLFRRKRKEPMLTILFKSRDDYRKFVVAESVKAAENSYGYYSGVTHKAYVFEEAGRTRAFLLHECTHQIYIERMIAIGGAKTSIWFFEGMAEFSEGAATPTSVDWGRIHQTNLWFIKKALKEGKAFKLTTVLSVDRLETLFGGDYESEKCRIAYAQVWALFYYLMEKHREKLMRYIRKEEEGAGGIRTFRGIFGSIRKLERDWRNFILSLKE